MNLNERQRQFRWAPLIILAALSLFFMALDNTGNLEGVFDFISDPATVLLDWSAARSDSFAAAISGPRDLQEAREQIAQLEERIDALERQNQELAEIQGEYALLQELLGRVSQSPTLTRVAADVIGRGPNPFFRDLIINRGSADGVRVGMPVESARGLVGQVYRTTDYSAQVLLLTDGLSQVPARLSQSRATGVISGAGAGGLLQMNWINLEAQLSIGEVVLTSGIEGSTPQATIANRFPRDVVIGRIVSIDRSEAALFQSAIIQPAVDFDDLESVFVITDFVPIDTGVFQTTP